MGFLNPPTTIGKLATVVTTDYKTIYNFNLNSQIGDNGSIGMTYSTRSRIWGPQVRKKTHCIMCALCIGYRVGRYNTQVLFTENQLSINT